MTRIPLLVLTSMLVGGVALPAFAQTAPASPAAAAPNQMAPAPTAAPQTTTAPMTPAKPEEAAAQEALQRSRFADQQAMFEAHLAGLHAGLTLTPDQEKLWPAVEQAIRGVKKMRQTLGDEKSDRRQDAEEDGQDPIAALKVLSEHLLLRGEALKALADSAAPLFATLSDDQRDRLPVLLQDMAPKRGPVSRMVDRLAGPDELGQGPEAAPQMRDHGPRAREDDRHREGWSHRDRSYGGDREGMEERGMQRGDRAEMDSHESDMRRPHPQWDHRDEQRDGETDDQEN